MEAVTWAAMSGSPWCSLQVTRILLTIARSGLFVLHSFSTICQAPSSQKKSFKISNVAEEPIQPFKVFTLNPQLTNIK